MKRSFPALIFALLCLFNLTLLSGLERLIGEPQRIDPDSAGYYLLMDLPYFLMMIGSLIVMLVGSPIAFIGYLKTKPHLVLTSLILLGFSAMTYYGYPIALILPVSLGILGYVAYKDVLRLSAIKKGHNSSQDPTD